MSAPLASRRPAQTATAEPSTETCSGRPPGRPQHTTTTPARAPAGARTFEMVSSSPLLCTASPSARPPMANITTFQRNPLKSSLLSTPKPKKATSGTIASTPISPV